MRILEVLSNVYLVESDGFSEIFIDDDFGDHDYDVYELADQAEQLSKSSGVNILRDKELSFVIVDDSSERVVGGLWTSMDQDEFSFDVIIDKQYQQKGLGGRLIDIGMSEFEQHANEMGTTLNLHVTNPILPPVLKRKYGLKVVDKHPDGTVTMSR